MLLSTYIEEEGLRMTNYKLHYTQEQLLQAMDEGKGTPPEQIKADIVSLFPTFIDQWNWAGIINDPDYKNIKITLTVELGDQ